MDGTTTVRQGARRRKRWAIEWPTLGLIAACYALWFLAGLVVYPVEPLLAMALFAVAIALHSSLQHEALHGHPTRNRHLNEMLVGLPIGLFYPYRRYKVLHLKHHADERLTDPYDDPESYYRALGDHALLPETLKRLLEVNNTFVGRLVVGPALSVVGFLVNDLPLIARDRAVRRAWLLHLAGLAVVVFLVHALFGVPVWLYALTAAYWGLSLIAVRSYCEHQWSERPDGRTIIVERSPLALLFLNNNLHLVHHRMPAAPWYRLPALYAERRQEWRAMSGGYVFRNYFEIARAFAFRRKEPVVHPALRREEG
ncbi:fatty acid desaturase [Ensifer soli]|uniref:fatty acid desaturase n=1 Tax=Ciceribacter sp. sgz301302 TaxID=3342379 RepID=UPI0035B9C90F